MLLTPPLPLRLRAWAWRLRLPLLVLGLTLVAGLVVARLTAPPPPTVAVLVSARALPAGATLGPGDVALREVPAALVPDALVADHADVAAADAADPTMPPTPLSSDEPGTTATPSRPTAEATPPGSTTAATPPGSTADDAGLPAASALIGRRLAVDVPAGLPLVEGLLVDPAAAPPTGTVVVPVRFADPAIAALLAPGTRVDVVAAPTVDRVPPERVAQDALVLSGPACTVTGRTAGDGGTGDDVAAARSGDGGGRGGDEAATAEEDRAATGNHPGDAASDGAHCETQDGPVLLAVPPDAAVLLSGAAASAVLAAVIVG